MIDTPIEVGESVSPQFDPRVTPVGRFLRRTKINELPQLVNILKGEMTFVGPRPEAPDLAELYPEEAKKVFSVKPGLVGPASILGRNEEEVYPPGVDAKKYYIENILPGKSIVDLEYIENQSVYKDIKYILAGVKVTLVGAISKRHIHDNWSQLCLLLCDAFLIACSYLCAMAVHSWDSSAEVRWPYALVTMSIVVLTRLGWNIYFGMYSSLIRYLSYHDIAGVCKGVSAGSVFLAVNAYALEWIHYPIRFAVIDWFLLILSLSGLRFILRLYWEMKHGKNRQRETRRVLIYGVCDEGIAACRAFGSDSVFPFEVVGFIDDAPSNFGKTVNGKKVLGDRHHIGALARLYRVEEVLIADQAILEAKRLEIEQICDKAAIKCHTWNPMGSFIKAWAKMSSDMLALKRFQADAAAARRMLKGKTLLINGSGGALGLELCRRMLQLGCGKLLVLDRYESYLNELVTALMKEASPEVIIPVVLDAEETGSLEEVFRKYRPDVVIHAGMRKYAPLLGVELGDIGRINYLRTFNLAKAASKFRCEWFLMISALTAPNGQDPLADSLRVAEVSLERFFSHTDTRLIVARICDVVENRGGIYSIIENQIKNREVLTLPGAEAQASFISKSYGAEFILESLVEAGTSRFVGKAQVFSCDPGPPILLSQLSERIANMYGLELGSDVPIRYMPPSADSVSMAAPTVPPGVQRKGDYLHKDPQEFAAFCRDFAPCQDDGADIRDWKEWTQRFIKACGPMS